MCVSVPHKLSLKNFKLGGEENSSNINTGILPFTVTPSGATFAEATTRQDEDQDTILGYAIVHEGNGTGLTIAEARSMRNCKAYLAYN